MKVNSETGHAIIVVNFAKLIEYCISLGDKYQPTNPAISLTALQNLKTTADDALTKLNKANSVLDNTINERILVFKDLRQYGTRVVNALSAIGISELDLDDANHILKKLHGRRAGKPKKAKLPAGTTADATQRVPQLHSVSQQSYDMLAEHFQNLVILLHHQPQYTPLEKDLTIPEAELKLQKLRAANVEADSKLIERNYARVCRNQVLYNAENSIVATVKFVKKYIKSVYGANAAEYKNIASLRFK